MINIVSNKSNPELFYFYFNVNILVYIWFSFTKVNQECIPWRNRTFFGKGICSLALGKHAFTNENKQNCHSPSIQRLFFFSFRQTYWKIIEGHKSQMYYSMNFHRLNHILVASTLLVPHSDHHLPSKGNHNADF